MFYQFFNPMAREINENQEMDYIMKLYIKCFIKDVDFNFIRLSLSKTFQTVKKDL